jgi:hypothetical protein
VNSWHRAARTALLAGVFALSDVASGLPINARGGATGALEWLLRTLVVASAAVASTPRWCSCCGCGDARGRGRSPGRAPHPRRRCKNMLGTVRDVFAIAARRQRP